VPITDYCDGARLTVRERVKLFLQVLQAVAYAHSRLVVHGDLKPSNIFVTDEGEVQLLDFGVATLLVEKGSPHAASTEFGHSALTPDYASPEQFARNSIGTASDVYSLGVLFHELLTGQRPYRLQRDTRAALQQAIIDADTLPPSRALLGEAAASARRTGARLLKRELQGELDAITMTALKKNQCERYASAESFHRDLERWLACERVHAHTDSLAYRMRTFARRNRLALSAGVVAGAALLVGFGSAIYQAQVAREQAVLAQRQIEKARAVQNFLVGLFKAADPIAANEQYEAALDMSTQYRSALEQQPLERQKELLAIPRKIAISLMSMGQTAKARELLMQALPKVRAHFGETSWEVVEYKCVMAMTHALEGDYPRAMAVYEELEPTLRALPAQHSPADVENRGSMNLVALAARDPRAWPPLRSGQSASIAAIQLGNPAGARIAR
jgi:serine/threonine-protein kinase